MNHNLMEKSKPNILLITSDQQHYMVMGINDPKIKTPNLDRLASMGTVFNRAYTCNPTCTPARASIITGKYPSQHGAYSLGTKLFEDQPTIGDVLSKEGYKTALIGKAHLQPLKSTEEFPSLESYPILQDLDFWRKYDKPFYGFDHIELARNHGDTAHVGQHYAIWMEEKGLENWRDYFRPPTGNNSDQHYIWNIPEEYHYNTWIAERTNALMQQCVEANENFFLWASFLDPHPPYIVPEPWASMYDPEDIDVPKVVGDEHSKNPPHFAKVLQDEPDFAEYQEPNGNACHGFHSHKYDKDELAKDIAVYYGMVSMMDKYIGKILDKLGSLDLLEKTLVLFTTDHGHFFGHHGLIAKGPFHYEDMVRIPFIVSLPGKVPAGKVSNDLQSLVDLAPTFLNICGFELGPMMTGTDQTQSWFNDKPCRDHVIVENRHQPTTVNIKTYIDDRYKLTVYYNKDYGELFDLEKDPKELKNLWSEPEYEKLKSEFVMKLLFAEMGKEPLPMPRIASA